MSYLPPNTVLGRLTMLKIMDWYDRPLEFFCKNERGQFFFANLCDESGATEKWRYVEIAHPTFFSVTQNMETGDIISIEEESCEEK